LAIASILDTQNKFYKILARYTADNSLAVTLAMDEVEAACEFVNSALNAKKKASKKNASAILSYAEKFNIAVSCYIKDKNGEEISRWILEFPNEYFKSGSVVKSVLSQAVLDGDLSVYDCLRLLIVHWAAHELRVWAVKI